MTDNIEMRYAEDGEEYAVWIYYLTGTQVVRGNTMTRPDWLERIVTLARVGGHFTPIPAPPPSVLFWCLIDEHNNLVSFERHGVDVHTFNY